MWKCPPSTILVPVDFGPASARALAVAGVIASKVGASLRVLHAETFEAPPYFTHEQLATIEREQKAARSQAKAYVTDFAKRNGAGHFETVVIEGSPTAAIVEAARSADLVVMGTHGRRGPSRWWMGSVAERVVHESGTPVLVVREDLGGVAPASIFDRPLVVSPERAEGDALRVASGLSGAFGGQVADKIATCQADAASERHATVMVVSRPPGGHAAEHWLRSCTLPMLFVPATVAV